MKQPNTEEIAKKRISYEEMKKSAEELDKKAYKKFKNLQKKLTDSEGFLDEDGYPTESCLKLISIWHWSELESCFTFIKSIWHLASWGWCEEDGGHDTWLNQGVASNIHRYHISTAGWSGNESIIRAMQKNMMLWHSCWVQSRRGGHYIFELEKEEDKV